MCGLTAAFHSYVATSLYNMLLKAEQVLWVSLSGFGVFTFFFSLGMARIAVGHHELQDARPCSATNRPPPHDSEELLSYIDPFEHGLVLHHAAGR